MTAKQSFELMLGIAGAVYVEFALFMDVYSSLFAVLLASLMAYDLIESHWRKT